ncbi:nuclease [Heliorestis acidaminivorans]|uniref:Nuclease n=1 Tax=Heliorestis acidaminivorans TaxID=553427 RepID=A0A6I0EXT2_9FIRM|nr:thermonuclease family protein [Heliorestis acidaminivorans]KAB2952023.1 nuclease [Heliorestis acidaminivorans]
MKKKILLLFLVVTVMLLPIGCNSNDINEETSVSLPSQSEAVEQSDSQALPTETTTTTAAPSSSTISTSNQSTIHSSLSLIEATVTRVVDGDTIKVTLEGKEETVRLTGVDTPETKHPSKPVEPYGPEASEFTKNTLAGKKVFLELDVQPRDRYGRILAYVWLSKPANDSDQEVRQKLFNAHLLLRGYGQQLTIPPNVKYADLFRTYVKEARERKAGLWGLGSNDTSNEVKTTSTPTNSSTATTTGPGPNGETIKGNINSKGEKIYHVPGGQFYEKTVPEAWFFTEEEARSAGFRASKR